MKHDIRSRKLTLKLIAASILLTLIAPAAFAQEVDPVLEEKDQAVIDLAADVIVRWSGQGDWDAVVLDAVGAYSGMHASKDGHYLAHDLVELKTYDDLGLSYQFIAADYLRKQLELPAEQGIIITAAATDGEGLKNGFQSGDIVLKVDDEPVDTQYDFVIALSKDRGSERLLQVRRNGSDETFRVKLTKTDVVAEKHWIIGVYVDEVSDLAKSQLAIDGGVAVTGLVDDGPAHSAGIVEHDIVSHINGQLVNSLDDLKKVVAEGDGAALNLTVVRRGKKINVSVQPVDSPRSTMALARTGIQMRWLEAATNQAGIDALASTDQVAEYESVFRVQSNLPDPQEEFVRLQLVDDVAKGGSPDDAAVADRLDRLEASMKRIEAALKGQLENSNGQ